MKEGPGANVNNGNDMEVAAELYARIEAVTAGTEYRLLRTEQGFELTVDVHQPGRRRSGSTQLWTYDVALDPETRTFTMTDVVRTERRALDGRPLMSETVAGRKVTRISSRALDGSARYSFSSADGHRLIRAAAEESGWEELMPAAVYAARGPALLGAAIAIAMVVGIAIAFVTGSL
ncbi:hypothetical protein [Streptomyces sp. NPDC046925]|uniref:hypothetical protein n=1 Tax=Streptomyces sp. NPDC046925 TaxID=3155375 RepID=UPI0033D98F85